MLKKIYKSLIIFSCVFFLAVGTSAQAQNTAGIFQDNQLKITLAGESAFLGGSIYVKGQSSPDTVILLSANDENNTFSYSIKTVSNADGNWSATFTQLLKSGNYYVQAISQNSNGSSSLPVRSAIIRVKGPFAMIIGVLSILVIILLLSFLIGWYASKLAQIKRYRRIAISHRDITSYYNIINNDVVKAMKNLSADKMEEGKISETVFLLKNIKENLDKLNKYGLKGIKVIGKYDIINKLENRKI